MCPSTFDVTSTCWPFSSCIQTADPHLRLIWCKRVGKVMGFSVRSEGQNYSIYPKVPFSPSEACGRWASADRLHCKTTGSNHKKIQSVDVREGADCERVATHFQSAKCQHKSTNSTALFFFTFQWRRSFPHSLREIAAVTAARSVEIFISPPRYWQAVISTFTLLLRSESIDNQLPSVMTQSVGNPGLPGGANSSDPSDLGREHCCGRLIRDRRTRQGESPGSEQTAECAADMVPSLGEGGWWRGGGSWLKHWIHFGVIIARSELLDFFLGRPTKKKIKIKIKICIWRHRNLSANFCELRRLTSLYYYEERGERDVEYKTSQRPLLQHFVFPFR